MLLQFVLYCSFLALDLSDGSIFLSSIIKFSIVIFCFWYALLFGKSIYQKQLLYLRIALLFTVIADLFILIYDYYFLGVLAFCVVQQLYALRLDLRLCNNRVHKISVSFLKRVIIQLIITFIISILLNVVGVILDILLIITVFYFICIMMNVWNATRLAIKKHNRINTLFAFGITLFLLCDINVGVFNLTYYISLSSLEWFHTIYLISSILMWAFYAPSQVLIALCANDN